jgi:large subunit ribosomal protein L23Ae
MATTTGISFVHPLKSYTHVDLSKAKKSAAAAAKGQNQTGRTRKRHTTTTFRRPKTLALPRRPTYAKFSSSVLPPVQSSFDSYAVLRAPLATEAAMRKMETCNTLVFLCDVRANKHHIRAAVKELYGVEAVRVNTLVRPDGQKKAYVRLSAEQDAMDIAGKIGFI